jgi:MFS family permease
MAALLVLLAGQAMATMDSSILIVASPSLRADLHTSDPQLQLVVAMYTIAFAVFVVTGARVGDAIGRRRAFLLGLTAFTCASLAGGLAPTPPALIVARGFQGAAGALMTPQVLSIIQQQFQGETRARAIGAYSMILAVGVAAGQVLGGLLVSAHLLSDAWRPALLLNAPVGALLLSQRHRLPPGPRGTGRQLDLGGAAVLSLALLTFVLPLTFGRDAGWPAWVWPSLAGCGLSLAGFVLLERWIGRSGREPLFDIRLLALPSVAAGVAVVVLVMAAYAGFLVSLTIHLQDGLGFSAVHAGLVFAIYASGFATASLTWTRAGAAARDRLPVIGPLAMGSALLGVGLLAADGSWPMAPIAPLLFAAGVGHAWGFSPLAHRLTTAIRPEQTGQLSGLLLTASLIGQVIGVAAFVGVYLSAAAHGSAHALERTTMVLAAVLALTSLCAVKAVGPMRLPSTSSTPA